MRKILFLMPCLIFLNPLFSQKWVEMAAKPDANLYEIQKEFYDYFKDKDLTAKGTGYKAFKRWEYFVQPRVYPTGNLSVLDQKAKNYADFLMSSNLAKVAYKTSSSNSISSVSSWTAAGPMGALSGLVNGLPRNAGRDNFLTFHPTNSLTIYAGAAGGGLWETTNGGMSWITNTDNLPVTAVSDLLIDPTNPNIMYLATGGGDDLLSISPVSSDGLYKSTDGGLTWTQSGLTFLVSQNRVIHKLAFDPTNPQIIFVATNVGIFRSIDGGSSFTAINSIACWDIKFNPGNSSIVYAAGTSFYRSTNSGLNFVQITSGIPTTGSNRMAIAVTPTNPSNVYVLASKASDSQFLGVYASVNDGQTFVTKSTSPNIIGNSCAGNSTGPGQGWFDLTIAASPITPGEIVVGGVNVWRSNNDGSNWTNIGCWNSPSSLYVHADIHELEYSSTGVLYSSNDGGIFFYTGTNWVDLTAQRNIAQIYKIGMSSITPDVWITGHQDNGTNVKAGPTYYASLAGDGMDCFIDRTDDNIMYAEQFNGQVYRSNDAGLTWTSISAGLTGFGAWVTPWKQDPFDPGTIYCGRNNLFKSTDYGNTWVQLGNTGGGGSIIEFAVSPFDNLVIYVLHPGSIRKTTDGGITWTNVTPGVPAGAPTFITTDPNNPNKAWVTVSGYTAGSKVYQTIDGGVSWINISSNLPNLPANCLVYESMTNDRIYIGMDVGVYYKDNSSPNWTLYNTDLPNAAIMDMEMTPASPGKLYAATYGRGVYVVDAVQATTVPTPSFSSYSSLCTSVTNTLVDNSSETPTSWSWSITPNTGVTFNGVNAQNPTVLFANVGTYTISMVSGNGFGLGSVITKTVAVYTTPSLALSATNFTVCDGYSFSVTASGATTYTWSNAGGNNPSATFIPIADAIYTVTGSNSGCTAKGLISVTNIDCWVSVLELKQNGTSFKVYPNPANDKVTLKMNVIKAMTVTIDLSDVAGKTVLTQPATFTKDNVEVSLNVSSLAKGVYFLKLTSSEGSSQTLKILKE
jgi:photosystem II stability/assembly factor-like uncharacterized protein